MVRAMAWKKVTFCGVRYIFGWACIGGDWTKGDRGACVDRDAKETKLLAVAHFLKPNAKMDALIHEAIHACYGKKLSEKDTTQGARDIGRFLRSVGVRMRKAHP